MTDIFDTLKTAGDPYARGEPLVQIFREMFGGTSSVPIFPNSGAPSNGTTGSFAGSAPKNSLCVDVTTGNFYVNTGTQNNPTWTLKGTMGGAGTFTGTFDGTLGDTTPAPATVTTLTNEGLAADSVSNGLTAVGTNRGTALALTTTWNHVTTAAASTGVELAALTLGQGQIVVNDGVNPIQVYAPGSITIDGSPGATGVALTNAKRCLYFCIAANTVISAQLGAVSS